MNTKAQSERHQRILLELVRQPGNDVCADCGGRAPRWASWNLGIFVCVQCAGVHRKMGTHISKVKSLTLDTWTREQVDSMKAMGNTKSNAKFNPDERRNRPPTNVDEAERHNELERYIVAKYKGRFMEHKPPPVPSKDPAGLRPPASPARSRQASPQPNGFPSPAANGISRSRTAPIPSAAPASPASAPAPPLPMRNGSALSVPSSSSTLGVPGPSSAAVPPRASSSMQMHPAAAATSNPFPRAQPATQATAQSTARSSVFDDLISLQEGSSTPQPPLQMNPWAAMQQQGVMQSPTAMSNGAQMWGQQPQQPQHSNSFTMGMQQPQQVQNNGAGAGQLGMQAFGVGRSASLGNMAFSPNGGGLGSPFGGMQPQQTGMLGAPMQAQPQVSPSIMMGQQAFGGVQAQQTGYFGGANSPFGQQSQSPQPTLFGNQSHSPQPMFGQQLQQQQPQQQQQGGAPMFGAFASSMMPGQQQQPQQTASPWQQQQQQQQQQQYGNAWGQGQANNGMW